MSRWLNRLATLQLKYHGPISIIGLPVRVPVRAFQNAYLCDFLCTGYQYLFWQALIDSACSSFVYFCLTMAKQTFLPQLLQSFLFSNPILGIDILILLCVLCFMKSAIPTLQALHRIFRVRVLACRETFRHGGT